MAYDEGLAQRIREALQDRPDVAEKKMFGGVCFLTRGNMACGVHNDELIVRVGSDSWAEALEKPHVREFDITGRSMKGWVMVAPAGHVASDDLEQWVESGLGFALTLPPKQARDPHRRTR